MQPKRQVRSGALQWVDLYGVRLMLLLGEPEPDRLDVAPRRILRRDGIPEDNRINQMLMLLDQNTRIRKALIKAFPVKALQARPHHAPYFE